MRRAQRASLVRLQRWRRYEPQTVALYVELERNVRKAIRLKTAHVYRHETSDML